MGPITVPTGTIVTIAPDGSVLAGDPQNPSTPPQAVARIKLVSTAGSQVGKGLDGLFHVAGPNNTPGTLPQDEEARLTPGALEQSNVDPTQVLVEMVEAQRLFDMRTKLSPPRAPPCAAEVDENPRAASDAPQLDLMPNQEEPRSMPSSALHVARTGLEAQDTRMRVIANNLANVSTTGFKRDRANFATLAYQDTRVAGQQSSNETAYATGLNLGTGVSLQGTARMESQGQLQSTGNALDLALDGDGFFQVTLPGGQLAYTRAGNFSRSAEGTLVTSQGYALQPAITVPEASAITVAQDGTVTATLPGANEATTLGQITVASFANPQGLKAIGDNFLVETGASGAAQWAMPAMPGAAISSRAISKPPTSTWWKSWST
jgi:flagellar basal-body rod protein FlgG